MKSSPSMYDCLVGKRCGGSLASEPKHAYNEKVAKRARRTTDDQLHTFVGSGYPDGRIKCESNNSPSSTAVVSHTPFQSVYHDEGLFVHIASFCDHRTTIRLCTVTKAYCKSRSHLTGMVLYRADANQTKPNCDIIPSPKQLLPLGHTYARRKPCTNEVAPNNWHGEENKGIPTNATTSKMGDACGERQTTPEAGGGFLDGQELIDALMLRVIFDLRWIPTPCPILHWGRKQQTW